MEYKLYLELALVVLLVVLMYQKSNFLNNLVSHPLAKLALLGSVVAVSHLYGRNAGLISALILILLFHNVFEGNQNMNDKSSDNQDNTDDDKKSSNDDDESNDSDDETSNDDETSDESNEPQGLIDQEPDEAASIETEVMNNIITNNDKTSMEEEMRKPKDSNKDVIVANIDKATNEHDPMAVSSETKEGFSLLN
jgi:cytoskeletal protein RodZ